MSNHHRNRRRYRDVKGRRVWVLTEPHGAFRPERLARIITEAGLEQARREADAQSAVFSRPGEEARDA